MDADKSAFEERIIRYRGESIIVFFSVDRCTHVAECLRGLPAVFDTRRSPWINPDAADPDDVARVVMRCPTGALHFQRTDGGSEESVPDENAITLLDKGPAYVNGDIELRQPDGSLILKDTRLSLCRCGASRHKRFCDGFHDLSDYDGSDHIKHSPGLGKDAVRFGKPLIITLRPNGPYLLKGPFSIRRENKSRVRYGLHVSLCRCGSSEKMPFCDNSHSTIGFSTE